MEAQQYDTTDINSATVSTIHAGLVSKCKWPSKYACPVTLTEIIKVLCEYSTIWNTINPNGDGYQRLFSLETIIRNTSKGGKPNRKPYHPYGFRNQKNQSMKETQFCS